MTRRRNAGVTICAYFVYVLGITLLCFSALVLLVPSASARELGGVSMPDQVQVAGKTLVLNGMGIREATILNVDVYVAGLYLESKSSNAAAIIQSKQTKQMVLHFVRDVDREDIVKAFNEGFKKNDGEHYEAIEPRVRQLLSWLPPFHDGNVLTLTYVAANGVQVNVGRVYKGTIRGDDFARALWSIWLGPKPPTSALKKRLLGQGS